MWGALSDARTGLSFTIAAGSSQRSHSRVRVPWDSRPYFTVSDLRLPFFFASYDSQGHGGIFYPASTRVPTEFTNELSFISSGEPNKSHHGLQFLCYSVIPLPRKHMLQSRWLAMDFRVCSLLQERVFDEPFISNGFPLRLRYSGFQASCYNSISWICIYSYTNLTENGRNIFFLFSQFSVFA
jgi:hypothetical protein